MRDTITNVQRYSLHDGGGIRTVAFLKGCPFRCPWCSNPENLSFTPQESLSESLCIHCSCVPGRPCPRMPIIPGYTDSAADVDATFAAIAAFGITRADVLPFHQLESGK